MNTPPDHPRFLLEDSTYAKWRGRWYVRPPGAPFALSLHPEGHKVVEHSDGTITVSPSILWRPSPGATSGPGAYTWHGYLVAGEWRPV